MIKDLIKKNRSYRRFYQDIAVERKVLEELVDLARLCASAANLQPLRYILSAQAKRNALIFSHLAWAGYLKDWDGPQAGERPAAYIIILGDKSIGKYSAYDAGIAAQSILLGATEQGLGGCIVGSIKVEALRKVLNIPVNYEILLVVALGKPKEKVVIEEAGPDGDIKYWRDKEGRHHVPKRKLEDIIIG